MRATKRHRPHSRTIVGSIDAARLQRIAAVVSYVGSVEHKDTPSFAGTPPRPRPDATLCDRSLAWKQADITNWLREAVKKGVVGTPWEGDFPRYAWYKRDDVVYEGRLVNREQGTYKGYGLLPDEWPKGIERYYA